MAGREPWAPAGDRHERNVERPEVAHPLGEVGVAREVDVVRAVGDEPERGGAGAQEAADDAVLRMHDLEADAAEAELVARLDLVHPGETPPAQDSSCALRHDDG